MSDLMLVDTNIHLAIDTSTGVSVGVARGRTVLASRTITEPHVHAERLMLEVRDAVAETGHRLSDLAGVVVGLGPGPFTGLRVGIVTAQTLSYVLGIPLKGVCSLDAVGLAVNADGPYVACSDARRKELYWATYEHGRRTGGPYVTTPDQLPDLPVYGPGADKYPAVHRGRPNPQGAETLEAGLMAAHIADLPDAGTEPLYLRQADATVPGARKSALPPERPERDRDGRTA